MHRNVERSFVVGFEPYKDINVTAQHNSTGHQKISKIDCSPLFDAIKD